MSLGGWIGLALFLIAWVGIAVAWFIGWRQARWEKKHSLVWARVVLDYERSYVLATLENAVRDLDDDRS